MLRQIRSNVFETNSSSVHSLTICSDKEYEGFRKGKYYLDGNKLISESEAKRRYKKNKWDITFNDWLQEEYIYTYDNVGGDDYENFTQEYITKSGDKIVAFGYYGHD